MKKFLITAMLLSASILPGHTEEKYTANDLLRLCHMPHDGGPDDVPSLPCTRIVVEILNTIIPPETARCIPADQDINGFIRGMVFLTSLAVKVDSKMGDLWADDMVNRYIHVQYCKDVPHHH